jgi:hypothetical protein
MRIMIAAAVLLTFLMTFAGCVQPRVTSPEYSDPYGPNRSLPEKRWWGEDKQEGTEDTEKFIDRWNHLKS